MAILIVPRDGDLANFEFLIELESVVFRLKFKFNQRESVWYLDIFDELQAPLRTGIKLVVNYPLLTRLRTQTRPPGEFLASDSRTNPTPPNLDELGSTVPLTYIESTT